MTEAEWFKCEEPARMLEVATVKTASRKLRHFALACCASIDHLITDPRSRAALAFATQHVEAGTHRQKGRPSVEREGQAAWSEAYHRSAETVGVEHDEALLRACAATAAVATVGTNPPELSAGYASRFACYAACWAARRPAGTNEQVVLRTGDLTPDEQGAEFERQARLLRDIFGNPFRPVTFSPEWRTSTVLALAQQMYDSRDFSAMPILADALQDAGCDNDDILTHCRNEKQVHVRGCWVVDLVLEKK